MRKRRLHEKVRVLALVVAATLAVPCLARADTKSWDWQSGVCGSKAGGFLTDQVVTVAPNTEVRVLPPSSVWTAGLRVYVGIYIGNVYFPQTSSADERHVIVAGGSVTIRSDTTCTNDYPRDRGVITYTPAPPPPPPPPTTFDFTYSFGNPNLPQAMQYIVSTSNAERYFEYPVWLWKPVVGGLTFATTTPAQIIYHFHFDQTVKEAFLYFNQPSFHWDYSQGHNFLYGSTDGESWLLLKDVPPPAYGLANAGVFYDFLPAALLGARDIWFKVELYSYGPYAPLGGVWTNTAQHSRYDINYPVVSPFGLKVNYGVPGPAPDDVIVTSTRGNATVKVTPITDPVAIRKVVIGSSVRVNGSAIDFSRIEAESLAEGTLPFTVNQPRNLYFTASVGGLMGGDGLFQSTAEIRGSVLEDDQPVAVFAGNTGTGIFRTLTMRPFPNGYENVVANESHPYVATPGHQYKLAFYQRLYAWAEMPMSHAFANFGGSSILTISDQPPDQLPVAEAGADQTVSAGGTVQLDGSGSTSPSGALIYKWTQVGGEIVSLSADDVVNPTFDAINPGVYRFELVVNSGPLASAPDYVNVTVPGDQPPDHPLPVAEAGPDQTLVAGSTVQLDGSGSTDPAGSPLTYKWKQVAGEPVGLSADDIATPTFVAVNPGVYRFELVVSSGDHAGVPDYVNVTVTLPPDSDGDGVLDTLDRCPDSVLAPTVVIDACDSGVPNATLTAEANIGCTITDLIGQVAPGATNHGQFVSGVAHLLNDLKRAGILTGDQKGAIQSCAAQAVIP